MAAGSAVLPVDGRALSTGLRASPKSGRSACFVSEMIASNPFADLSSDQFFIAVWEMAWRLQGRAVEQDVAAIDLDLVVAIGELEQGPWRRVVGRPEWPLLPMTLGCLLLDVLLDELERVTAGFGARVAIATARAALDPLHDVRSRTKVGRDASFAVGCCCFCLHRSINAEET